MKTRSILAGFSLGLCILFLIFSTAWSATHKHLGCWKDMEGQVTNLKSLTLAGCMAYCSKAGYAYAGLKKAQKCSCNNKYDLRGVSNTCNYTCEGGALPCGGENANDVYYAIDTGWAKLFNVVDTCKL